MKTVFVGAGPGCKAVLELIVAHRLATLSLEIIGVADLNPDAVGMRYARDQGWLTFTDLEQALGLTGLELVIELTGIDQVREEIYHRVHAGVRVMDHSMARVFWDLDEVTQHLRDELDDKIRLEAEIRKDRRRLQEILDSLPDAVMLLDPDGRIERVNRRFETESGEPQHAVLGKRCADIAGGAPFHDDRLCPRLTALDSGQPMTMITSGMCINSKRRGVQEVYHEITANPVMEQDGGTSVVLTSREVTEQILLKRETEEAARRFAQIVEALHGLITIRDVEGRYEVVNPAAAAFFEIDEQDLVGKTAAEMLLPEMAAVIDDHDRETMKMRRHLNHEERHLIGGREHVLICERFVLNDYRDQPVGVCCVANDVTEARRLQNDLLQSEKHAAVGKLAGGVAHEINNPLTGILTFAEELQEDAGDPAVKEDLAVIIRETLRCRQIVRDLLDFSRQTVPVRRPIDIEQVILKVLGLVKNQATFHDIVFTRELARHDLTLLADANQLQQVLLNLIINARDAMGGKGEITVTSMERPETNKIEIHIADQGSGISPEIQKMIFEPFFSTKGERGNGLGLAVVRRIMMDHGGDINVESSPNQGSVFRLIFPGAPGDGARPPGSDRAASGEQ